jgi:hypothetical protein
VDVLRRIVEWANERTNNATLVEGSPKYYQTWVNNVINNYNDIAYSFMEEGHEQDPLPEDVAHILLKEIRRVQQELRQIKREVQQIKNEIKAEFKMKKTFVSTGRSSLYSEYRKNLTLGREALRRQEAATLAPYESVSHLIERTMIGFDQKKLLIEGHFEDI